MPATISARTATPRRPRPGSAGGAAARRPAGPSADRASPAPACAAGPCWKPPVLPFLYLIVVASGRPARPASRVPRHTPARVYGYLLGKWCAPARLRLVTMSYLDSASRGRDPAVLVTGFPADAFGTNCYVVATGAGRAVPGRRPRHRRARPARRACSPSTACTRPRCCSPTATSTTPSRSRRSAARAASPPTCTRPTGRCWPTRPRASAWTSTALFGGRLQLHRAGRRGRADRRRHARRSPASRSPSTTRPAIPAGRCCSGCPAPARLGGRRDLPLR